MPKAEKLPWGMTLIFMLKPYLSKQARQQIAKLSRSNPRLLDDVVGGIAKLVHEPFTGLHRPKPLVGALKGFWSVRVNRKDRIVYQVEEDKLLIASVEGHYNSSGDIIFNSRLPEVFYVW